MAQIGEFQGQTHVHTESAAGTGYWRPTAAYLDWVKIAHPFKSGAEMIALGWCKAKGRGRKLGKAKVRSEPVTTPAPP